MTDSDKMFFDAATTHKDVFVGLAMPFADEEVTCVEKGGRKVYFADPRAYQNRMDAVLGPNAWSDEYVEIAGELFCKLTVELPDGSKVHRMNSGGRIVYRGDDENAGLSVVAKAFKRACSDLGVGRYLYRGGVPCYDGTLISEVYDPDDIHQNVKPQQSRGGGGGGRSNGQQRRQEAPRQERRDDRRQQQAPQRREAPKREDSRSNGRGGNNDRPPKDGRQFFAWLKDQGEKNNVDLVKYINAWAQDVANIPGRIIEWNDEEVEDGYKEAVHELKNLAAQDD